MNGYIRARRGVTGVAATAIVALGTLTAPPARYDSVIPAAEFAAVQLQSIAAPLISAVANSTSSAAVVATETAASASAGLFSTSAAAKAAAVTSPIDDLLVAIRRAIGTVLSPILVPIGALASTLDFACLGGNINGAVCAVAAIVVKVVAFFGPYQTSARAQSATAARRSSAAATATLSEPVDPSATESPVDPSATESSATAQTARPTSLRPGRTRGALSRAAAVTQAKAPASSGNDTRAALDQPTITPAADTPTRHKAPRSASSRIVTNRAR